METSCYKLSDGRSISFTRTGSSGPTVIFESGLTCDKEYWKELQVRLIDECSTFSYDRSGLGNSDFHKLPKSIESITSDLEEVLTGLEIEPPFIFVGHSFGGTLSKHYSYHFKEHTQGIVFVDASDSDFERKTLAYRTESQMDYWKVLSERPDPDETEAEKQEIKAFSEILKSTKNLSIRNDIPTKILVCDNITSWFNPNADSYYSFEMAPKEILKRDNKTWIDCHKEWLSDASYATLVLVEDCSHNIHIDNEDSVFDAICEVKAAQSANKAL